MTVNMQHPWLSKYKDYINHFRADAVKIRSGTKELASTEPERKTNVSVLYRINKIMKNVFLAMQMDPNNLYSMSDAKSVLNAYLISKGLISEVDPGVVVCAFGV